MRSIAKIINALPGALREFRHIRVENDPWLPLVIERVGSGPRGGVLVSVAHYFTQNGDLFPDPEMVFELPDQDRAPLSPAEWAPVSITLAIGSYREAVYADEAGRVLVVPALVRELRSFARMWNSNIREQGFVEAFKSRPM